MFPHHVAKMLGEAPTDPVDTSTRRCQDFLRASITERRQREIEISNAPRPKRSD